MSGAWTPDNTKSLSQGQCAINWAIQAGSQYLTFLSFSYFLSLFFSLSFSLYIFSPSLSLKHFNTIFEAITSQSRSCWTMSTTKKHIRRNINSKEHLANGRLTFSNQVSSDHSSNSNNSDRVWITFIRVRTFISLKCLVFRPSVTKHNLYMFTINLF